MSVTMVKKQIHNALISAAQTYKNDLAGNYFLFVYDKSCYLEVLFKRENFLHLTGVGSNLSAKNFYKKATDGILTQNQIYFNKQHPIKVAKKKVQVLNRLPELTQTDVFLCKDFRTNTVMYKFGINNLEFFVGVVENRNKQTQQIIDHLYVPQTMRIKDKSFDRSTEVFEVEYIFKKNNKYKKYDTLNFGDSTCLENLTEDLKIFLDSSLFEGK